MHISGRDKRRLTARAVGDDGLEARQTRLVRSSKPGWPADPNQRLVRIGEGEFVHAPQVVFRGAHPEDLIAEFGRQGVDVLEIQIETERVSTRDEPAFDRIREVKVSAFAVGSRR